MRKLILIFSVLFPALAFAQTEKESYEIYSKYLQHVKWQCHGKADFVIRKSTDYGRKEDAYIPGVIDDLRGWYNHDPSSYFHAYMYDSLMHQLKGDTTWVGLLEQLNQRIKKKFIVKNQFAPNLNVTVIRDGAYHNIFGTYHKVFPKRRSPKKMWAKFHKKYPIPAYLVDLSDVESDGNRAVFYFVRRWDGIGNTDIIFFKKIGGEWQYVATVNVIDY
jgi:hypothetical protein